MMMMMFGMDVSFVLNDVSTVIYDQLTLLEKDANSSLEPLSNPSP